MAENEAAAKIQQANETVQSEKDKEVAEKNKEMAEKTRKIAELEQLLIEMQYAQADEMHEAQNAHQAQLEGSEARAESWGCSWPAF